jgi:hypothetical protein
MAFSQPSGSSRNNRHFRALIRHPSLIFRICRYIADTERVIGTSATPSDVQLWSDECGLKGIT